MAKRVPFSQRIFAKQKSLAFARLLTISGYFLILILNDVGYRMFQMVQRLRHLFGNYDGFERTCRNGN